MREEENEEQGEREEEGTECPCAAKLRTKFKIPLLHPLKCQEITSVHHHTDLNIDFKAYKKRWIHNKTKKS